MPSTHKADSMLDMVSVKKKIIKWERGVCLVVGVKFYTGWMGKTSLPV